MKSCAGIVSGIGAVGIVWYSDIGESSSGTGRYAIVSGFVGSPGDQLRVRREDVVALHERFHRELPVHREARGVPPLDLQALDVARIGHVGERTERLAQRRRVVVEVDEGATAPGLEPAFAQGQVAAAHLVLLEDRGREDELALPVGTPLPAVKRAGEAVLGAAAILRELDAAMPAMVVERLDGLLVDTHDDHGLVEDLVDDEVAGLFDLLEPAGHLPDVRPEFFALEAVELGVVIPTCVDAIGPRHGERNCGLDPGPRRIGHCSLHGAVRIGCIVAYY